MKNKELKMRNEKVIYLELHTSYFKIHPSYLTPHSHLNTLTATIYTPTPHNPRIASCLLQSIK